MLFFNKFFALAGLAAVILGSGQNAWAQSSCSSDGQRPPAALIERFISADCDACWADAATLQPKVGELALDWIVPSAQGDAAPLSAAASRDALIRLLAASQPAPARAFNLRRPVMAKPLALRVARGVALGGYMGASIELTHPRGKTLPVHALTARLLLVEAVPAGTDGTPVARNLVRNSLEITWNEPGTSPPPTKAQKRLYESRPMSIPEGANPDRLRVVGWVEEADGKVVASAASVCVN